MKKSAKVAYYFFCGLFVLASVIPSAGMFIRRKSDDSVSLDKKNKDKISLTDESGKLNTDLNKEVDSYVSENFAFRDELISADTFFRKHLLGVSANDEVIIGKDGWLYYSETEDDFINLPDITETGIKNIIHNLEMMDKYVTEHGGKFLVTVAPNKNTVYPEYMPSNYITSDASDNLQRLTETIGNSSVSYCDLKSMLLQKKSDTDGFLYHKKDTHWNNTGAMYASGLLLDSLGVSHNDYCNDPYTIEKTWHGDLDRMLWPGYDLLDYQNNYNINFNYDYQGRYKNTDDMVINTVNENKTGSMLMFRDSFGAAVIPFFSEDLGQASYIRALPYPVYMIESSNYNYVVLEIVERNIDWLQKEAPMHYADKADDIPKATDICDASVFTNDDSKPFFHIYGELDIPADIPEAGDIYVTLDSEKGSCTYKAYNCYESDLLHSDQIKDNGYSLYVPCDELDGEYSVTVTVKFSDRTYSAQAGNFSYHSKQS